MYSNGILEIGYEIQWLNIIEYPMNIGNDIILHRFDYNIFHFCSIKIYRVNMYGVFVPWTVVYVKIIILWHTGLTLEYINMNILSNWSVACIYLLRFD